MKKNDIMSLSKETWKMEINGNVLERKVEEYISFFITIKIAIILEVRKILGCRFSRKSAI